MADDKVVYTITVFSDQRIPTALSRKFRWRDWGYYFEEKDARDVIENNLTDISELDYYHFALLAKKGEGPLAIGEPIQWYEFVWDEKRSKLLRVDKIECPEQYKQLCV